MLAFELLKVLEQPLHYRDYLLDNTIAATLAIALKDHSSLF
jgi:hypothetical protein